ncbi:ankyrin repeat and LEM domain-containing protein 2-like [Liolophura sinensis]|uniref:ankyrin repeat and LEM domain-containing protein 2-like n=1 Tax=Liolophura sinensis TaxID=3198878 RepID=UPI0031592391
MENIVQELKGMSVDALRSRLRSYGEDVGPITNSTKFLFVKKLAKKLYQERYPSHFPPDNTEVEPNRSSAGPDKKSALVTSKSPVQGVSNVAHTYYGICLPEDLQDDRSLRDAQLVFTDKTAALKAVKAYKGSRFKTFKSLSEAEKFSHSKIEICSPLKSAVSEFSQVPSSEGIAFKAPKMPELVALRKLIEKGDEESFRETVWTNPRYLISSGDTPVILQEGFRYNALHVAAKSNQPIMCRLIIDTIQNSGFLKTLYPMDSEMTCNNRIKFITDLYLNMPDKGFCESPLHFACKFGYAEVVEVFASHPSTDRKRVNKHGETPSQVVCSRCSSPCKSLSERIQSLLEDSCFVPLLRSDDNCSQPVIGEPWSPESAQRSVLAPTASSQSPRDPQLVVRAYAGPMSPAVADTFHRHWVTPPSGSPDHVKRRLSEIRREDCDKGIERIGRKLAHDLKVPWAEYWQFLKAYVDLRSSQGLSLLNNHLRGQYLNLFPEECAIDQGWLLEKDLKNSSLCEFEEDSPSILDSSHDVVFGPYEPSSQADGLARLDLSVAREEQNYAKKRGSRSSSSSSGSSGSSESNYSSCRSGSESDDETYHNTLSQNTEEMSCNTEMSQNILEMSHYTQEISHNTHELSHNTQGMPHNTQEMSHNTQELAHNTQEMSHNTQEMSHSTQEMSQDAQEISHNALEGKAGERETANSVSGGMVNLPPYTVPVCGSSRGDNGTFPPPEGTPQGMTADAFTRYRSAASSSTDLDTSPEHTVRHVTSSETSSDIRLPCVSKGHAQSTDKTPMSPSSIETLVSSLAADMESKLTISWALNDSNSNENESFARLAALSEQGTSDLAKPESSIQVSTSWGDVRSTCIPVENGPEKMVTDADEQRILKQSKFSHLPGQNGCMHFSSVQESNGRRLSESSGVSQASQQCGSSTVSDKSQVSGSSAVSDEGQVFGSSAVSDKSQVSGSSAVSDEGQVSGSSAVSDEGQVSGSSAVSDEGQVSASSVSSTVMSHTYTAVPPGTPKTPVQSQSRYPLRTSQHFPPQVFIQGTEATKLDLDVLRALEDVPVDPQQFPYIHRWKKLVMSFDEDARQSWPTPARARSRTAVIDTQDTASSPVLRLKSQSSMASPVTSLSADHNHQHLQPSRLDLDSF